MRSCRITLHHTVTIQNVSLSLPIMTMHLFYSVEQDQIPQNIFLLINAPRAMQNMNGEPLFCKTKHLSNFVFLCVLLIYKTKY